MVLAIAHGTPQAAIADLAPSEGYLLDLHAPDKLLDVLQDLRNGVAPDQRCLQRVRVTVHPRTGEAHGLSPRELEVLTALTQGLSYKMIADKLTISFETVRSHIKCIYSKMAVNNCASAVAKAIHAGLVAA
jgi:DNA-binding NarL/FixJ family response regulator